MFFLFINANKDKKIFKYFINILGIFSSTVMLPFPMLSYGEIDRQD
jgi:hypothetical protein